MKILIVGEKSSAKECQEKFGDSHSYIHLEDYKNLLSHLLQADVVFDFNDSTTDQSFSNTNIPVFFNSCKVSLVQRFSENPSLAPKLTFGFNGMPTLLNCAVLEISTFKSETADVLKNVMTSLNTDFQIVDDRVGLVTPRVICMIINEAYFTIQEKTATREDIDVAMKLGTNYPFGPFEWCERIGIKNVYELLHAMYEDTRDERYKICPLLKREYLLAKSNSAL